MKPFPWFTDRQRLVFRHEGAVLAVILRGDPCPRKIDLHHFYRIAGRLYVVVGLHPEDGDVTLAVTLSSCSPAWALKTALEHARRRP